MGRMNQSLMKTSYDNNTKAFFELVRAGLWNGQRPVSGFTFQVSIGVDWGAVYLLAEEQSVIGLVAAGIDTLAASERPPQEIVLQFVGQTLQLEKRNKAMNEYVAGLFEQLRKNDIYALLVKGQGMAQCYERPLWRACGDIDLLLDQKNYEKAKALLIPLSTNVEPEYYTFKHIGMTMPGGWEVELHGSLRSRLSRRVDSNIDAIQEDTLKNGNVRVWRNGNTDVLIPAIDNDVIFLFTHILHHFYVEGIGLRQICDWCRFLWTYRDELDAAKLAVRLEAMGLTSEWKAFGAFAVSYLGMPVEAMPVYSAEKKWKRKAERIMVFVLESGNFGHSRVRKAGKLNSLCRKLKDFSRHAVVFPVDSVKFFCHFVVDGIRLSTKKDK